MRLILTSVQPLSGAGTALMVFCIGFVLVLTTFCVWRILREPSPSTHHHTPLDIDTGDTGDDAG